MFAQVVLLLTGSLDALYIFALFDLEGGRNRAGTDDARKARLLKAAERDARRLGRERVPWADASARFISAAVAATRGDKDNAVSLLVSAESGFERVDMALLMTLARRCRGQLKGGEEGKALVREADKWLRERAYKNPAAVARLAPGGWEHAS